MHTKHSFSRAPVLSLSFVLGDPNRYLAYSKLLAVADPNLTHLYASPAKTRLLEFASNWDCRHSLVQLPSGLALRLDHKGL